VHERILVLGIGNILLQDDGAGVRAVERLTSDYQLPAQVEALDGGVMGLELLPYIEDRTHLLVIDAVATGQDPGTLVRLEGESIPAVLEMKLSPHQAGVLDLLAVGRLRGTLPERIVIWGIEPASTEWGMDLTPAVASSLDELIAAVAAELQAWNACVKPVDVNSEPS
jgi:hydrogenase maturation protease